jgi:hypothetical protein
MSFFFWCGLDRPIDSQRRQRRERALAPAAADGRPMTAGSRIRKVPSSDQEQDYCDTSRNV